MPKHFPASKNMSNTNVATMHSVSTPLDEIPTVNKESNSLDNATKSPANASIQRDEERRAHQRALNRARARRHRTKKKKEHLGAKGKKTLDKAEKRKNNRLAQQKHRQQKAKW
jgi:hypothetical protein